MKFKIHLFGDNDYRNTAVYHLNAGKISSISHWTGFNDRSKTISLTNLGDILNFTASGLCWVFRQNCMNASGCNLGIPFLTIQDNVHCFYPQIKPIPSNQKLITGFNTSNPQCGPYKSIPGYLHGLMQLIYQYTYPFFENNVGVLPGMGYFTQNFSPTSPPNLIVCLIFNLLWIVLIFVGAIVLVVVIGIIYASVKKFIENKGKSTKVIQVVKDQNFKAIRTKFKL